MMRMIFTYSNILIQHYSSRCSWISEICSVTVQSECSIVALLPVKTFVQETRLQLNYVCLRNPGVNKKYITNQQILLLGVKIKKRQRSHIYTFFILVKWIMITSRFNELQVVAIELLSEEWWLKSFTFITITVKKSFKSQFVHVCIWKRAPPVSSKAKFETCRRCHLTAQRLQHLSLSTSLAACQHLHTAFHSKA